MSPASSNAKAVDLGKGLRRLFPSLAVSVDTIDYGNALAVGIVVDRIDRLTLMGSMSCYAFRAALKADPKIVGGKILRAAYPRGWAQP